MERHTDLFNFADDAEDEPDTKHEPEYFSQAVLYGTDWTVKTVLQQIADGNIDLSPDFQRRDAWSQKNKCRFIESVVLQLPIPQIVLAERRDQRGTYIVLDGKQRLITLAQFAGNLGEEHPVMQMSQTAEPLKLSGLKILDKLNRKTYRDIAEDIEISAFKTQFDNHTIRSALIRNWPSEDYLYEVFIRLNTGSSKLSPQELRQAMKPGPFTKMLSKLASESKELQEILGLDGPDFRMRDVDLLLRLISYSYRLEKYRGNLKLFLDETHEIFNADWRALEHKFYDVYGNISEGLRFLITNFGDAKLVGRRWKEGDFEPTINRALLDVQLNSVLSESNRKLISENKVSLADMTVLLCTNSNDFVQSIAGTTKSMTALKQRFGIWKNVLKDRIGTVEMAEVVDA